MAQIRVRDLVPVEEIDLTNMLPCDTETLTRKLTLQQLLDYFLDAVPPSGGGGGSLDWVQDGNSPIEEVVSGRKVHKFTPGEEQVIYTTFTVPDTYQPGMPIRLHLPFFTPDVTGDVLFEATATLIKPGEDITDTTNQHVSTNASEDLSVDPLANKRILQVLDLSTEDGEINSVAVGAMDEIQIALKLHADTDSASDICAQLKGAMITVIETEA